MNTLADPNRALAREIARTMRRHRGLGMCPEARQLLREALKDTLQNSQGPAAKRTAKS